MHIFFIVAVLCGLVLGQGDLTPSVNETIAVNELNNTQTGAPETSTTGGLNDTALNTTTANLVPPTTTDFVTDEIAIVEIEETTTEMIGEIIVTEEPVETTADTIDEKNHGKHEEHDDHHDHHDHSKDHTEHSQDGKKAETGMSSENGAGAVAVNLALVSSMCIAYIL